MLLEKVDLGARLGKGRKGAEGICKGEHKGKRGQEGKWVMLQAGRSGAREGREQRGKAKESTRETAPLLSKELRVQVLLEQVNPFGTILSCTVLYCTVLYYTVLSCT